MSGGAVILGIDQGVNLTGWCCGDGAAVPIAGAFRYDDLRPDDIIGLARRYRADLRRLHERFHFTHAIFEAPLLDRYRDKVLTLRRRYGIDMVLELLCDDLGVVCEEEPFGPIKRELAGWAGASKDDMVYAAQKLGIVLPVTKAAGKEDAADASAAWLIGVRLYARQHLPRWDQVLYSRRR
jgi:hypothetical protein